MKKTYTTGWVTTPSHGAKALRTIPLDAGWWAFDAEKTQERLGNEVRLTLTGIRVKSLIGPSGTDNGIILVDLSAVRERVDGHPVLDTWLIYNDEDGSEVGLQINAPNGRIIRIFSSAHDTYTVQEVRGEFVKTEVNNVTCLALGDTVLRLSSMQRINLREFEE